MQLTPSQLAVSRQGLVAEYCFNGNADDTSGGGHHGVVHGATLTLDRFGHRDSAYSFDGRDDFIEVAPPPPLNTGALTVSVWVRYDKQKLEGWSNCIVCQDDGNDDDQSRRIFQLSTWWNRIVWHRMVRAPDPTARVGVRVGVWCHLAVAYEGDVHGLYVDGARHDSVTHPMSVHADEPVYIGRKGTPEPSFYFRGAIDDVRLYNRALDAGEIRALFAERGYQKLDQPVTPESISGTWETAGGDLLRLSYDGHHAVTGSVTSGGPGNPTAIKRGTFDPATGSLRLEGDARRPHNGAVVPYVIEGTLQERILSVTYAIDADRGHATLTRVTPWRSVRRRLDALRGWMRGRIEPVVIPIRRKLLDRRRPSKAANAQLLRERNESVASLVIRDATPEDIPALADLHVKTWNATYPDVRKPPTYAIREWQWREAFQKMDGSWFCVVIENSGGQLVGFAKGVRNNDGSGGLSKIYLLGDYQRVGLGRRLVGHVTRRFLAQGITSMYVSADPANPSCAFYERLGAVNKIDRQGRVSRGSYVWRDLATLSANCPIE